MSEYEALNTQLRKWLAEDEAVAHAATYLPCCAPLGWRAADRWSHRPRGMFTRDDTGGRAITLLTPDYPASTDSGVDLIRAEDGGIPPAVAEHIVTWDPARVLADIAGKRALLDWAYVNAADIDGEWDCGHTAEQLRAGECTGRGGDAVLAVLRCVAAGYVDRPEFKAEWRLDA